MSLSANCSGDASASARRRRLAVGGMDGTKVTEVTDRKEVITSLGPASAGIKTVWFAWPAGDATSVTLSALERATLRALHDEASKLCDVAFSRVPWTFKNVTASKGSH